MSIKVVSVYGKPGYPGKKDYLLHVRLLLFCVCCALQAWAQTGPGSTPAMIPINDAWQFVQADFTVRDTVKQNSMGWKIVHLPHTWNVQDTEDDEPGYYRGPGWYKKRLSLSEHYKDKELYLFFEGANQQTTVYVNGRPAGKHTGGYAAFYMPVSGLWRWDRPANEIAVRVDNSHDVNIPPLSADFTFYGGLYRDVYLLALDKVHVGINEYGSRDLFITTPVADSNRALVHVRGSITNRAKAGRKIRIVTSIYNRNEKVIVSSTTSLALSAGSTPFAIQLPAIRQPHLWAPEDPYLYRVETRVVDASSGAALDELSYPLGIRWFRFDAARGFFLNGKPCKLVGTSRHQDYSGLGNAVPAALAVRDVEWLKQMGGNFLRVAHYPQHPAVLEACDRLGIIASVEIPVVNEITESDSFYNNCAFMLMEMIRQQYNHPSVVMWCYMNEILLKPHYQDDPARQQRYIAAITRLAERLDSLSRAEDPARYTMMAHHGDFDKYHRAGLTRIPMLVGWNLYSGWYGGKLSDFPAFLDRHHRELPDKPLLVTEYGADADPRIRSFAPVRFDKSVEYTTLFHQYYIREMIKRPFVAAAMIWNLADFNSESRMETMPHINNKGLLQLDRTPKDPYYFYQALLSKEPVIKILAGDWTSRAGMADSGTRVCYQPVQVAANMDSLELWVNGQSFGWKKTAQQIATWPVPFRNGLNRLDVTGVKNGDRHTDRTDIQFRVIPYSLTDTVLPFSAVHVLLGANRYYFDKEKQQCWLPGQPYRPGSFGYIGGSPFMLPGNNRLPYGTDKSIAGTPHDPLYQSQLTGIGQYRLDVPPGVYELVLHFAELQGVHSPPLPYNLSDDADLDKPAERIFNVKVNDRLWLDHFNIAQQVGLARALVEKTTVTVKDDKGIRIVFVPITGEPVLNALELTRLY